VVVPSFARHATWATDGDWKTKFLVRVCVTDLEIVVFAYSWLSPRWLANVTATANGAELAPNRRELQLLFMLLKIPYCPANGIFYMTKYLSIMLKCLCIRFSFHLNRSSGTNFSTGGQGQKSIFIM